MNTPITGSCQCGSITFSVNAPALLTYAGFCNSSLEPDVYIRACRKQPWVILPERARPFDTQPDDAVTLLQAAQDFRERA